MTGGSIVSSAAMTARQIAIARAADRMLVTPDGYGFLYVPGPRFCACGRPESDCDQSRAACPQKTVEIHVTTGMTMTTHWAEHARGEGEESDIIIAGRQVPFVQVGMIVHPDDCLNCERDGSPLWCSALVVYIHDDDETARLGMMATLLFRNGERREEPCDELRRRWRLARDFDQARVYTGRWGAIPRGSVWPGGRSGPWRKSARKHEFVQSDECEGGVMPHWKSMMDRGDFLFAFDLNGKDVTVQIASVVAGEITGEKGKKNKKPVVSVVGKEKRLGLNATNSKTIAAMYGNYTEKWIGEWITLYPTTTSFGSETFECIRIRPTKPRKQAARKVEPQQDASTDEAGANGTWEPPAPPDEVPG